MSNLTTDQMRALKRSSTRRLMAGLLVTAVSFLGHIKVLGAVDSGSMPSLDWQGGAFSSTSPSSYALNEKLAGRARGPVVDGPVVLWPEAAADFDMRVWRRADGLPTDDFHDIAQTFDGYLWLAMYEGIVRWDGHHAAFYNNTNTPAIPKNHEVLRLFVDSDGALWVVTTGRSVIRWRHGEFELIGTIPSELAEVPREIAQTPDGAMWFHVTRSLHRYTEADGQFVRIGGLPAGASVTDFHIDDRGTVWVGTTNGLHRVVDQMVMSDNVVSELEGQLVFGVNPGPGEKLLVSHRKLRSRYSHALYDPDSGSYEPLQIPRALGNDALTSAIIGEDLWLWSEISHGVWRASLADLESGAPDFEQVLSLSTGGLGRFRTFNDRENNIWGTTDRCGLVQLRQKRLLRVTWDGLPWDPLLVMCDANGAVWTYDSRTNGGLLQIRENEPEPVLHTDQGQFGPDIVPHPVRAIMQDSSGRYWFDDRRGTVWCLVDGQVRQYHVPFPTNQAFFFEDAGGVVYAGHSSIFRFENDRFVHAPELDPDLGSITNMMQADDGSFWICAEFGFARHHQGQFTKWRAADVGVDETSVLPLQASAAYESDIGSVWVSSRHGLIHWRDGEVALLSTRHGIPDRQLGLIGDDLGGLWLVTQEAIAHVMLDDLETVIAGGICRPQVALFEHSGVPRSSNVACKTPDGMLWFQVLGGIVRIDPTIENTLPPNVVIERAWVEGQSVDIDDSLRVPPGGRDLDFRFAALSLVEPEKVRFRHQLVGYDENWVDGGGNRAARYTNVPPGEYTFRVIAANNDGLWNEAGASLAVVVRPHFYETRMFLVLIVLAALVLMVAVYQLRVRSIKSRNLRLHREIDERRRMERSLRITQHSVDTSDSAILWIDEESRIAYANDAACQNLGYERDELYSVPIDNLSPTAVTWSERLDQIKKHQALTFECVMRRRDGSEFPIEASMNCLEFQDKHWVFAFVKDITQRKHIEKRQKLMMAELDHRVKNTLTAMMMLAQQTASSSMSMEDFMERYTGRLHAVARTHEALAVEKWSGVSVSQVIRLTVLPLVPDPNAMVTIAGNGAVLPASAASPFCLAMHELATNALKHGALRESHGRLQIEWDVDDDETVRLRWTEQDDRASFDGGPPTPGMGLTLIRGLIEHELGGSIQFCVNPRGLDCLIRIPTEAHD